MEELSIVIPTATVPEEKNTQFRATVPASVDFLVRALLPLKNAGKDWSIGEIATEALTEWLKKPENLELIRRYNLLEGLRERGFPTEEYEGQD